MEFSTTTAIISIGYLVIDVSKFIGTVLTTILTAAAVLIALNWSTKTFIKAVGLKTGYYEGISGEMLHEEDYSNFRNRGKDNEM